MRIYIGFDDTDTVDSERGTGRLVREFVALLPTGCHLWGVIRQQLPRLPEIPYTSNNSSACAVIETTEPGMMDTLVALAAEHIRRNFVVGSDPGLCLATQDSAAMPSLISFARECCVRKVSQAEAMSAARGTHLSGHGGTQDGIIGAAAGVGLTRYGWAGRFIEFGDLRAFPPRVDVGRLEAAGIRVLPTARDEVLPALDEMIDTEGWLRPRLLAGQAVLPVRRVGPRRWTVEGRRKDGSGPRSA